MHHITLFTSTLSIAHLYHKRGHASCVEEASPKHVGNDKVPDRVHCDQNGEGTPMD